MEFKIDLEVLKKSVEERKNNSMIVEQAMGKTGVPKTDKRTFLANLLSSVNQGDRNNTAVQALQTLNETVEATRGVPTAVAKNMGVGRMGEAYTPAPATPNTSYRDGDAAFEREVQKRAEDMVRLGKMNASNSVPLSEAVNNYAKTPYVGQPMNEQYAPQQQYSSPMNEQILKSVADVMGSAMFDKMINESFRNVITEIYTKEKIENVIKEYVESDIFKKVVAGKVADTIKQLQEIQKKKTGNV